jgi:alanyl-tRNA synthetase
MRQDWRVEFVCGGRAEHAAHQDFLRIRTAAEKLSCAPEEMVAAAERALSERDANFKRTRALLERLAEIEAAQAVREANASVDGLCVVLRVFEDVEPEFLGFFGTQVAKTERSIALLAGVSSGNVLFAQHPTAARDMNALLKQILAKVGGKGGGTRDFARGRLDDPTQAEKSLAFAKKLLTGNQAAV